MNNYQITPQRVVLYTILVFAAFLGIMTGIIVQRRNTSEILLKDQQTLLENLSTRENIEQEQLTLLEEELSSIRDQINDYEDRLESLETSYPVFSQTKVLSTIHNVEIITILREGKITQETPDKTLEIQEYSLELVGSLQNCLNFLSGLEEDSRSAINLNQANFNPYENSCYMQFQTAGVKP